MRTDNHTGVCGTDTHLLVIAWHSLWRTVLADFKHTSCELAVPEPYDSYSFWVIKS